MKKDKSSLTKDELQKQLNKKSAALDRLEKKTKISEEAHAREAKIQLALERVRARTMAMQKSEELQDVVHTLLERLKDLDVEFYTAIIILFPENSKDIIWWLENKEKQQYSKILVPYADITYLRDLFAARENGRNHFSKTYSFEEKNELFHHLFSATDFRNVPEKQRKFLLESEAATMSVTIAKNTGIHLTRYTDKAFSEEDNAILKRFVKVFDQTYTRFLDLQKTEAQAREAQIEIGLERVRSRAMAMQSSEELNELIGTLFAELTRLDLKLTRCSIWIFDTKTNDAKLWMANSEDPLHPVNYFIPFHKTPVFLAFLNEWKKRTLKWEYKFEGQIKKDWDDHLFSETELSKLPEFVKAGMRAPDKLLFSASFNNFGGIHVASLEALSDEHFNVLLRFAKVFDVTYTRFLDLKKAEAQAREAEIQLALERVRARTMAMHKQNDLLGVLDLLVEQLIKLGVHLEIANFSNGIPGADWDLWIDVVTANGELYSNYVHFPRIDHPYFHRVEKNIEVFRNGGGDLFKDVFSKEEKDSWQDYICTQTIYKDIVAQKDKEYIYDKPGYTWSMILLKDTWVSICRFDTIPFSDEEDALFRRFANAFGQAYTRFLDLQKAEAQAREAQIEAALERVRSKTMAMHSSQDIAETVDILFHELTKLHVDALRCGISIIHDTKEMEVWTANPDNDGKASLTIGKLPMSINPSLEKLFEAWKNKESHFVYDLSGQDLIDYFTAINNAPDYPIRYDLSKLPPRQVINCFLFTDGALFVFTTDLLTSEAIAIFKRFATLFGQTYRRYLDLQKAEALAREATIEAALEKVRGNAMAMHNSNDLSSTASMVFTELRKLGINPIRCGVGLLNKESRKAQLYSATSSTDGDSLALVGWVMLSEHPVLEKIYDTWLQNEDYFPELSGTQLKSYYELLLKGLPVKVPDWEDSQKQYGHFLVFSVGCLYAWSEVPYNDAEIKILKRFAAIIDLTFRRYIELQKAEANAIEAIRRASLDRVRAETASMRTTADLEKITPLIWNELTTLGVPFIRCGVFIMDEEQELIHSFLSTPDGKAIAAFQLPYDSAGELSKVLARWHKNEIFRDHWDEAAFANWTKSLVEHGAIASEEKYSTAHRPANLDLHFFPFLQGMLYVGSEAPLGEEEMHLVQTLADAFSTAYARYEDFNKLEAAKRQVESTLNELQATQKQLIQSEKMASLGELTAGIAHEIQNPLNFVNNFSEVNKEIIDEASEEMDKGNYDEVKNILNDIKENSEKINHHGKRADAIVKGMLQHSRSSTGVKEPTDINAIADEYLRLSYHGLRAKDKSFNAEIKTNFDKSIGKINIIPQDIGRVLLNLYNNAFYACGDRNRSAVNKEKSKNYNLYQPTVSVTTKKSENSVLITVSDNGNGIPQKVIDKIFQPFFTTKPTGQGTGLGLSLSYDIIKAHGGEIKVETKEGEGCEFVIQIPKT